LTIPLDDEEVKVGENVSTEETNDNNNEDDDDEDDNNNDDDNNDDDDDGSSDNNEEHNKKLKMYACPIVPRLQPSISNVYSSMV